MANNTRSVRNISIFGDLIRSFNGSLISEWQQTLTGFLSGGRSFYITLGIGVIIVYAAAIAGFDAMRIGYRHAYGISREIPWGILISTYIFFVVTSTGLCIVSSIGHVFGVKDFMPIAQRAVFLSIVTIFAGFTVIFFDIENPFRMALYNVISPNLTSNIWWMGTLYGAYMFFMTLEFVFLILHRHRLAMYAGLAGLLSGVSAHSNLGAIFGMLHSREYWFGPYMPIYFIASAMMSGCATIIFFTYLGYRVNNERLDRPMERAMEVVSKLAALMIAVLIFFTTWKILTGIVGAPGKVEAIKAMLTGPYALNFWVFEVGLGMVIPFVILLKSRFRDLNAGFIASLFMIIGIFFMRYDLVLLGQVVPSYHELGVRDFPHLLSYIPSIHEIAITVGGMGIVGAAFLLGEKVFQGHKSEIH